MLRISARISILVMILACQGICQVAVAPRIGTLGIGADAILRLAEGLNARIGANFADLDLDRSFAEISYNAKLDLRSYQAILDWHVFGGSFRVCGGIIWNENKASLSAKPSGTVDIGGTEYPAAEVGRLTAKVGYDNELAPYVGIGLGNAVGDKGRFGLLLDLGVMFTGALKAKLSADGPLSSDPDFQDSLAHEQDDLNDDLDKFDFYPVLSVAFYLRF